MFKDLKRELREQGDEWRKSRDDYLAPMYRRIGEYMRMHQNNGMTISELADKWGTTDRSTIYKFLDYAVTPFNGKINRRTFSKPTNMPDEPFTAEDIETNLHPASEPTPPTPPKLTDCLVQVETLAPGTVTIETTVPVPPELWPKNKHEYEYPTEPWTGAATWENGILITDMRTSGPLHAAQKALGGIDQLIA